MKDHGFRVGDRVRVKPGTVSRAGHDVGRMVGTVNAAAPDNDGFIMVNVGAGSFENIKPSHLWLIELVECDDAPVQAARFRIGERVLIRPGVFAEGGRLVGGMAAIIVDIDASFGESGQLCVALHQFKDTAFCDEVWISAANVERSLGGVSRE